MLPTTPSSHHVRWRPELETLPEELEEVDLAESLYDISLDTHSEIDVVRLLAQAHPNPELKEYYKQKFRLLHLSELDEI